MGTNEKEERMGDIDRTKCHHCGYALWKLVYIGAPGFPGLARCRACGAEQATDYDGIIELTADMEVRK